MRSGIEEPDEHLFETVAASLDNITRADRAAAESVVLGETWSLIARLGFAPSLDVCINCGREIGDAEDASFDYVAGGLRCKDCAAGMPGRVLPAQARNAIRGLMEGKPVVLEHTAAHWRLLARFLTHHVTDGNALKSLAFLEASLREPE
jgi:recombinational DNA repair protein (RecF pathway)